MLHSHASGAMHAASPLIATEASYRLGMIFSENRFALFRIMP
jgi:hypothetical protein